MSKNIVIDASIARSCGAEGSTYPTSKNCRDFLNTIYEKSHKQVISPEILAEWKKHRSQYAQKWQVKMYSKKLVHIITDTNMLGFEDRIKEFANPPLSLNAMLKDCLLVKAAINTDKIVASLDEKSRKPFSSTSQFVSELKKITWVNPNVTSENVIQWLNNGAKNENKRFLENYGK